MHASWISTQKTYLMPTETARRGREDMLPVTALSCVCRKQPGLDSNNNTRHRSTVKMVCNAGKWCVLRGADPGPAPRTSARRPRGIASGCACWPVTPPHGVAQASGGRGRLAQLTRRYVSPFGAQVLRQAPGAPRGVQRRPGPHPPPLPSTAAPRQARCAAAARRCAARPPWHGAPTDFDP